VIIAQMEVDMKKYAIVALLLALPLGFVACSGGGKNDNPTPPTPQTFQVTFVSNGGNAVETMTVNGGTAISAPNVVRNYYEFEAWCSDPALANKVTFPYTVTRDATLYAKWEQVEYRFDVSFTGQTATINFDGLHNNNVYLVKTNISETVVAASNTGRVNGVAPVAVETGQMIAFEPVLDEIQRFNANPPPLNRNAPFMLPKLKASVGDSKMFWVWNFQTNEYYQKRATLRVTGQHCNLWIVDDAFSLDYVDAEDKVPLKAVESLRESFDTLYPIATNLLGFEYGGGPGGDGGIDGDVKIQILVGGSDGSYFSPVDWYPQSQAYNSNEAEIIYIGLVAGLTMKVFEPILPNMIGLLAHEFQHLINWNQKTVKNGLSSPAWYNEMLSDMAVDVVKSTVPGSDLPLQYDVAYQDADLSTFVLYSHLFEFYNKEGITEWNIMDSHTKATGFGMYLMRNYGGPRLLHDILASDKTQVESIAEALDKYSPGLTFEKALTGWGEALLFAGASMRPKNALAYDKTVTSNINGIDYTVKGAKVILSEILGISEVFCYDLTPMEMRPHSISLHTVNEWKNKSGNLSITFERPADPNIVQYLILK
jgi:hypothetical protein